MKMKENNMRGVPEFDRGGGEPPIGFVKYFISSLLIVSVAFIYLTVGLLPTGLYVKYDEPLWLLLYIVVIPLMIAMLGKLTNK